MKKKIQTFSKVSTSGETWKERTIVFGRFGIWQSWKNPQYKRQNGCCFFNASKVLTVRLQFFGFLVQITLDMRLERGRQ